jgi:hypothetical protein
MAKISSKDIFTNPDIYAGVRKSAQQTLKLLDAIDKKFKAQATTLKKTLGGVKFDNTKSINEFLKAINEVNKIQQQALKVNQARQRSQDALNKTLASATKLERERSKTQEQSNKTQISAERLEQTRINTKRKLIQEQEREAKAQAKAQKAQQDANSAYKQLEINTRNLKNQSKELGAQLLKLEQEGKKGSKVWLDTKIKYDQVTASASKMDAQLKKLDKAVGDNFRNVGNYQSALSGLNGVMATFGASFGLAQIFDKASSSVMNFEQANATLSAVLGKTRAETGDLQKIQRELGKTSGYTASQVGELQIELARLGFTEDDIKSATNSVLMLAKASGSELGRASEVAGATLRGFGLSTSETQRVVDTMAKSFDISALGMENFAEAMKYVAPVAKAAGVSLEETTAMLGVLSNVGISGSMAGTSLRQIFSQLSGEGKTLTQALEDLSKKGLDLAGAEDEVGRNAKTALLALTDNTEGIKSMSAELVNAEGSAYKTATTMSDTLGGSLAKLGGAFEGYILDVNESSGASSSLREAIDWLTKNLTTILDTILLLAELFVKYKAVVITTTLANKLMASSFITASRGAGLLPTAMNTAKGAFQAFNTAIKSNIIGIVVVLLYELYNALTSVQSASDLASDFNDRVAESMANIQVEAVKERQNLDMLVNAIKKTNYGTAERTKLIDSLNAKYKTNLKDTKDDVKFQALLAGAYKTANDQITKKIALMELQAKFQLYTQEIVKLEAENLKLAQKSRDAWGQNAFTEFIQGFGWYDETRGYLDAQRGENTKFLQTLTAEQAKLKKQLEKTLAETQDESVINSILGQIDDVDKATTDYGGTLDKTTPKTREFNYELKKENEYLSKQRDLLQELNVLLQDRGILQATDKLDTMLGDALERVKKTGETFTYVIDPESNLQIDPIIEQIETITTITKEAEAQRTKFAIEGIELKYKAEYEAKKKLAEDNYKDTLKDINDEIKAVKEGIAEGTETTQTLTNLTKEKKRIEAEYTAYVKELDLEQVEMEKDKNTEIEIENAKLVDRNAELDKEELERKTTYNEAQLDGYQEFLDAKNEKDEKDKQDKADLDNKEIEAYKAKWDEINNIVKASADFFIQQSERKIDQLDKEIEQAQKTYDLLKGLAESGNIDAKESLAEQQRIIEEANRKKALEERRQQIAKLAETAFNTYNQKIQDGKKGTQALTETIRDITLLTQLVGSLMPAYEKGTEDTGNTNGRGVDGRGGFNAILHPNERVLTKGQNKLIGDLSNEQLAQLAFNYRTNKLNVDSAETMSALDFSLLLNKVDKLTKVIQDKPDTELNVGQITQTTLELVEQKRKGNTTTYNRFKIKR